MNIVTRDVWKTANNKFGKCVYFALILVNIKDMTSGSLQTNMKHGKG
jgi:hypothetical protein